jgi:hypothetical protein
MFRVCISACALLLSVALPMAYAAPTKTTTCEADSNRTMKKAGKTYTCGACETCKTTSCDLDGGSSCTVSTTRTCSDCAETTATGPKQPGGAVVAPGTLSPGVLERARAPMRLQKLQTAPAAGSAAQ